MDERVDVDLVAMESTARWMQTTADELADAVDGHMRAVRAFVGGEWTGVAAGSHEGPWADWEEGARRVIGSFITDVGALRSAAAEYSRTD
ncbi:MAG: WXG100 family type VII secretion target, partial [Mycobacterium sp.]|nr:WXG100 family type VII secretion target [Mycobacterium sp.]